MIIRTIFGLHFQRNVLLNRKVKDSKAIFRQFLPIRLPQCMEIIVLVSFQNQLLGYSLVCYFYISNDLLYLRILYFNSVSSCY